MDIDTISMLCHPYTHENLRLIYAEDKDGVEQKFLEGVQSGERFPIHDGIPVLFDAHQLEGFNLKYNEFYRKTANFYDPALKILASLFGGEAKFRQEFLTQLEIDNRSKVLEISIGTGTNISLLPDCATYYGIDLSWDMLKRCQRNIARWGRRVELFYGNAECLPFHDEIFDVILHVGGINAFGNRKDSLKEMVRVARPGTRIVIVDETAKLMKALSWMPSVRNMIEEWGDRFTAPACLLPGNVKEVETTEIIDGYFYLLAFRKS